MTVFEVSPEQVKRARLQARAPRRMRATEAGRLVYVSGKMWGRYESGASKMDLARFELFLIKTGQVMRWISENQEKVQ